MNVFRPDHLVFCAFVLTNSSAFGEETCFEEIKSSICNTIEAQVENCGSSSQLNLEFADKLWWVYENSTSISQQLLCSVVKIVVEPDHKLRGAAFDQHDSTLFLNQSWFTNDITAVELFQHEDLRNFVANDDREVRVTATSDKDKEILTSPNAGLFMVVNHELGHLLGEISTMGTAFACLREGEMPLYHQHPSIQLLREQFHMQGEQLSPEQAVSFYEFLNASSFVSPYAFTSYKEDFADTFLYYVVFQKTTMKHQIYVDERLVFDTESERYQRGKKAKFDLLALLVRAVAEGDETIGLKMLTCNPTLFARQ